MRQILQIQLLPTFHAPYRRVTEPATTYLLRGAALDLTLRVAGPHSRHPHVQDKWAQAVT